MYNNYEENQSNLKFLFVFSMKKYQGNGACCCSLWQMVIRRDSRVSTVPTGMRAAGAALPVQRSQKSPS